MKLVSVFTLFVAGGALFMCILTLLLVALFFSFLISCAQAAADIQMCDVNLEQCVLAGGLKVALICPIYGCIIYMISLIIRIVQKPRA